MEKIHYCLEDARAACKEYADRTKALREELGVWDDDSTDIWDDSPTVYVSALYIDKYGRTRTYYY